LRQPFNDHLNRLVLLAYWSVRQKLNRVSSVQFSCVLPYCISDRGLSRDNNKVRRKKVWGQGQGHRWFSLYSVFCE